MFWHDIAHIELLYCAAILSLFGLEIK